MSRRRSERPDLAAEASGFASATLAARRTRSFDSCCSAASSDGNTHSPLSNALRTSLVKRWKNLAGWLAIQLKLAKTGVCGGLLLREPGSGEARARKRKLARHGPGLKNVI